MSLPCDIATVTAQEEPVFACLRCNTACVNYLHGANDTRTKQRIENRVTDPENPRPWD